MPVEHSKNFGASIRRLLRRLRPERLRVAAVLVFAIVSVTLTVIGPRILGEATNIVVEGHPEPDRASTSPSCTGSCCSRSLIYVVAGILSYIQSFILAGVVQRSMHQLRARRRGQAQPAPARATSTASPAATCSAGSPTTSTTSRRASSRR